MGGTGGDEISLESQLPLYKYVTVNYESEFYLNQAKTQLEPQP
ncbi:hypothetical protein ABZ915_25860 [Streptomyces sp. NPDC046915]